MITITFVHPDTGLDTEWSVNATEHSPFQEKRFTAIADAGDYIEPDVIDKGGYDLTTLQTNPLAASEMATFYLFRRATKRRAFDVGASVVPLVGTDYTAIRLGDIKPVSLHGGRYFSFTLKMRVIGVIES